MNQTEDSGSDLRSREIRELVKRVLHERAAGQAVSDEALIRDHAELMPELAEELENLRVIEAVKRRAEATQHNSENNSQKSTTPSSGLRIRCPDCHSHVKLETSTPFADITCSTCGSRFSLVGNENETRQSLTVGHFELIERVGIGGFGTVWRAHDTELDRMVAVKIPRHGELAPTEIEQFLREARTAAQLNHSNIIGVHEAGRDEDTVYIVSDLVQGVPMSEWLTDARISTREAVELCQHIADALHYAHEHGVIHRDLKPQNIMIDLDGQPHLTDFGLARRETGEVTITLDGQILGTPAYMPPEQAKGEAHQADRRSDIYSLGVILFELLTGELPFRGSASALVQRVINDEPPSPRKLNQSIPRDVETICLRCLEKDPRKRFDTAQELADEFRRFSHGQPINARPIGPSARVWRWCNRNPMAATVVLLLLIVATAGPLMAVRQTILTSRANQAEETALGLRDASAALAAKLAFDRGLSLCEQGHVDRGMLWFTRTLQIAPPNTSNLRHVTRINLSAWNDELSSLAAILPHRHVVRAVAFSPDGEAVLTACSDKIARIWNIATGEVECELAGHEGDVTSVAFSPDGQRILTGANGAAAWLWDAATGKLIRKIGKSGGERMSVYFSPNGQTVLTSGYGTTARLWNVANGKLIRELSKHAHHAETFSHDGKTVLTVDHDGITRLWNATTGEKLQQFKTHEEPVWEVQLSQTGNMLVTASVDRTARIWDVTTGNPIGEPLRHSDAVTSVAFSRDGSRVLTGCNDNCARAWNVVTGRIIGAPMRHHGGVKDVAFSPTEDRIATASSDRTVRIWHIAPSRSAVQTLTHEAPVRSVAYSPDGKYAATGVKYFDTEDVLVRLWDPAVGDVVYEPRADVGLSSEAVAFSPNGQTVVGACDHTARLWGVPNGATKGPVKRHPDFVTSVSFSPNGSHLLTGCNDGCARFWDVATGTEVGPPLQHDTSVLDVAFSPSGDRIVTACSDGSARIWDAKARKPIAPPIFHDGPVQAVTFNPDGSRILTSSSNGMARLWDSRTGKAIGAPMQHRNGVSAVDFSADGSLILTGCDDASARLWDVSTLKPIGPPYRHEGPVKGAVFSPDHSHILTGSDDKTASIWEFSIHPVECEVARIVLWTEVVTGLAIDDSGSLNVLDRDTWLHRRKALDALGGPPIQQH